MRWTVILLGCALVATSCVNGSPQTSREPGDPPTQWSPPQAYTYEVASSCGERSFIGHFRIHVRDGKAGSVTALDTSARAATEFGLVDGIPSLEDLLDEAAEAERTGADLVDVRRTDSGRPLRIEIDHDTNAIDDEACYVIRRFVPEERTASSSTEAAIYVAVIRRLMQDEELGRSASSLEALYIVDGPLPDAGRPRGDVFAQPRARFDSALLERIKQTLAPHVWPPRWVGDLRVALPEDSGDGSVGNNRAVLVLGDIERRDDDEVHVPITWWCDKCSRWLTYVVVNRDGRWVVTGTTGPVTES